MTGNPNQVEFSYETYSGKKKTVAVNMTIDLRDYVDTPGFALLVVAANTHLSVAALLKFLNYERSKNWVTKRRWLFQKPGTVNQSTRSNEDGKDGRAIQLMAENPDLSLRALVSFLKDNGIKRGKDWVRQHRCDGLLSVRSPISKQ